MLVNCPKLALGINTMNVRYYGLDMARAIFMLLGVVLHASQIFRLDGSWQVSYHEQNIAFNYLADFIATFRMQGFFIISGFFFLMVYEKYGAKFVLVERCIRLAIPMIVVGISFNTLLNMQSEKFYNMSLAEYILNAGWLRHLWFLGNLLIYIFIGAIFAKFFIVKITATKTIFILFILAPLAAVIGSRVQHADILFFSPWRLFTYLPAFIVGMYLWPQRTTIMNYATLKNAAALFVCYIGIKIILLFIGSKIGYTLSYYVSEIGNYIFVFSIIIVFLQIATKKINFIDHWGAASYSIYLLHLPLLIIFFPFIQYLNLGAFTSFFLLCALVLSASYAFHRWLVSTNNLMQLLFNGKPLKNWHWLNRLKKLTTHTS